MISRVADGCFWMTRYLERVDTLARLLSVHHALHIDAALPVRARWRVLIAFSGQEEDFAKRLGPAAMNDGEVVQRYLTWDAEHPASLYSALRGARENARTVREIMSLEAWEAINDLWLWLGSRESTKLYDDDRSAFYERLMTATQLFHGASFATMLHDDPFTFMKLGRAVERAALTARILDDHGDHGVIGDGAAASAAGWLAVLRCCCAYDPFFRSGSPTLDALTVTRFLLFDRTLPRSVLYNLDEARRLLFSLRQGDPPGLPRRSRTALERLRGELLQMDLDDVAHRGLHETFDFVVSSTHALCDAIHDDYLDPPDAWMRHCVRALELVEGLPVLGEGERAA